MRSLFICSKCAHEGNVENSISTTLVNDSGHYFYKCNFGHKTVQICQDMKFESLFDYGANAIIDGYYREGVLSFTASLERFYEYFIKVTMEYNKVDRNIFNSSWKKMSNQSERQLGAFITAYLICFGEEPNILNSSLSGFRNKVAHKGYIPNRDETIQYGQEIMSLIIPDIIKLKASCNEQVISSIRDKVFEGQNFISEMEQEHGGIDNKSTMAGSTILSITNDDLHVGDLNQKLLELKEKKQMLANFPHF